MSLLTKRVRAPSPQSARSSARKFLGIPRGILLGVLLLLALAVFIDGVWIEPFRIQVTHYTVPAPVQQPLKIAHLTDLHTDGLHRNERNLLSLLRKEAPDVIVITGDTLTGNSEYRDYLNTAPLLSRLRAPKGVWMVRGNWETFPPRKDDKQLWQSMGVTLLVNQGARVSPNVWLIGVDEPWTGKPDLAAALKDVPANAYKIALFHSPQYFEKTAGQYQLALAGHSHGGQVRIPFLPPLWLPAGVGKFVEGWFEKDGSRMYVSRGIGMSTLPVRFDCRPELPIITLVPQT
jgi:uncharacterized protein